MNRSQNNASVINELGARSTPSDFRQTDYFKDHLRATNNPYYANMDRDAQGMIDEYNANNKPAWGMNNPKQNKTKDGTFLGANTNDLISGGIGLAGSLTSALIQNQNINRSKYASKPVNKVAANMKTTYNINPQLDAVRDDLAETNREIDNNTASSKVALARKQAALTKANTQRNMLYATKENEETKLINADRANRQSVANANIDAYNQWKTGETQFNNAKRQAKADNWVSLTQNLAGIGNDLLTRGEKREFDNNNLRATMAANPNVNPEYLKAIGFKGITDKMVEDWKKANKK